MTEVYNEIHHGNIRCIQKRYYNEKNKLIYFITEKGSGSGRYTKYKYDKSGELLLCIEIDSPDNRKEYMVYE